MARRDPAGIRLITQQVPIGSGGRAHLKVPPCLIDGEVVCCDERGVTAFNLLRHRRNELHDLLEAERHTDLRKEPIEVRKATLASILCKPRHGVRLNERLEHPEGAAASGAPASWAWRGLLLRGWTRVIVQAARRTGSLFYRTASMTPT